MAKRRRRRVAALHGRRDGVEVARADFTLVLHGGEALLGRGKLGLLKLHERLHVVARVAVREMEHGVVEAVEAGQRDELELVPHRAELTLETADGRVVEVLAPVERRRT